MTCLFTRKKKQEFSHAVRRATRLSRKSETNSPSNIEEETFISDIGGGESPSFSGSIDDQEVVVLLYTVKGRSVNVGRDGES